MKLVVLMSCVANLFALVLINTNGYNKGSLITFPFLFYAYISL